MEFLKSLGRLSFFFFRHCTAYRRVKGIESNEAQNVLRQSLKMALIGFDQYNLIMCSWRIFPSFIFQVENRQRFILFVLSLDIINQTLNEKRRKKNESHNVPSILHHWQTKDEKIFLLDDDFIRDFYDVFVSSSSSFFLSSAATFGWKNWSINEWKLVACNIIRCRTKIRMIRSKVNEQ